MSHEKLWQTKLAARIHDPAEKALVLPLEIYKTVQRAVWCSAAADRPQWPLQEITITTKQGEQRTFAVAPWAQVRKLLKQVIGPAAAPYLIDDGGTRPHRYRLVLAPEAVRFAALDEIA